ncbi:hypothetical protein SXCC_02364 [Gluconacetobacter sp. SXCC-1]|nr:hypothetical protein SXCC_02364 [Gluconacetobacter sp. SXCC-1]
MPGWVRAATRRTAGTDRYGGRARHTARGLLILHVEILLQRHILQKMNQVRHPSLPQS